MAPVPVPPASESPFAAPAVGSSPFGASPIGTTPSPDVDDGATSEWAFSPSAVPSSSSFASPASSAAGRGTAAAARPAANEAVGTASPAVPAAAVAAAAAAASGGGWKGHVAKLTSKVPFLRDRSQRELAIAACAILIGLVPILAGLAIWATRTSPDVKALEPGANDVPANYRPGDKQPKKGSKDGPMTGPDGISNFGDYESDYKPGEYSSEPWSSPSYKPYGTSDGDVDTSSYYSQYYGGPSSYYNGSDAPAPTADATAPPPSADGSGQSGAPAPPPPGGSVPIGPAPPVSATGLAPKGGTVAWRWGDALSGSQATPASNVAVTATGNCRIINVAALGHATTICYEGGVPRVTKVTHLVSANHKASLECDGTACSGKITALDMPTPIALAGGTNVAPLPDGGSVVELALAGWNEKIWINAQGGVDRIEHAINAPFTATLLFTPTGGNIQSTAVYGR